MFEQTVFSGILSFYFYKAISEILIKMQVHLQNFLHQNENFSCPLLKEAPEFIYERKERKYLSILIPQR